MTRLLLVAGLTSVGVASVHFLDGNHASFSFPLPATNGAVVGVRGAGRSRSEALRPQRGQVGVLRIDDMGQQSQFVLSPHQPLEDRLVVSASVEGDGAGVSVVTDGEKGRTGTRGGSTDCVKYVASVGSWGQKRDKWFPEEGDARDLLIALDHFCPIPWLREELASEADDGDEDIGGVYAPEQRRTGDGRGASGVYLSGGHGGYDGRGIGRGPKKPVTRQQRQVIIYQRDRNRKLVNSKDVGNELWERLGLLGWRVKEIVHDAQRHPCELIEEIAGADVLLTPHGFQSMLSIFMRPGSVLFEVYPHKYYKPGYRPMAEALGLRYAYSHSKPMLPLTSMARPSTEMCMRWYLCRWYVRRSNVELGEDELEVLIRMMLKGARV